MAPSRSSRLSGADTDTSMADAPEPIRQLPVDPMVSLGLLVMRHSISSKFMANTRTGC
jgi:hypothetical protein